MPEKENPSPNRDLFHPCTCKDGDYQIIRGLDCDDFSRGCMTATDNELREARAASAQDVTVQENHPLGTLPNRVGSPHGSQRRSPR